MVASNSLSFLYTTNNPTIAEINKPKSIIKDNIDKILEENYVPIKESLGKEFKSELDKPISINHLSDIIFTNMDIPTYINTYKDYTSIIYVYRLDSKIILGYDKYNRSFKLYIEIGNI